MPIVYQDEESNYLTQLEAQHEEHYQRLADLFPDLSSTPLSPTLYYEDLQDHSEDTLVSYVSYSS